MKYNRILLTGASGGLGQRLREDIAKYCNILRISALDGLGEARANEELVECNLADMEAVKELTRDVDLILHFGGISTENTFANILEGNIVGFYNVFEAARQNGVKRIIWPSSVHAVGFYDRLELLETDCPTRPDSLYGVSKVFGEGLAQYYWDKFNLETVSIRIGSCFPEPTNWRMMTTWQSYADLLRLVERCLIVPRVGHTIVWGISDNDQAIWDNRKAGHLGYKPQDNSEVFRDKIAATTEYPAHDVNWLALQGGHFATDGHFEDED